jgi:hypothetical protein
MFEYDSEEIETWKEIYLNSDRKPILIAMDSVVSAYSEIKENSGDNINIYPVPAKDILFVNVQGDLRLTSCELYNLNGERLFTYQLPENPKKLSMNSRKGIYLLKFTTDQHKIIVKKIILI